MSERTFLDENGSGSLTSRRGFLTGSAAALAGGALMAVPGVAFGKGNGEDKEDGDKGKGKGTGGVSDVDILNYALVLERLEYRFYEKYLDKYTESQIEGAAIFDGFGSKVRSKIYQNLKEIRDHEKTHVETLIAVIKSLKGKPVGESETTSASIA